MIAVLFKISSGHPGGGGVKGALDVLMVVTCITRWWFHIFLMFIPTWGNDPI